MSKYKAYRDRVRATGSSLQDATLKVTKRKATTDLMSSPTLSYVRLNDDVDFTPTIASDKETFHKRTFLFVPESIINVGDYIHQTNNATYLAVDKDIDDFGIHPQLIGELCNETFKMKVAGTEVIIGYDEFKRPMYRTVGEQNLKIPCVMTMKVPSMIDNSAIPLPEGAMIIKIPYKVGQIPPINYVFKYQDSLNYKVTNVSEENVINGIGYVEIRLQRGTGES